LSIFFNPISFNNQLYTLAILIMTMGYKLFNTKKAQVGGPAQMIIGLFIALMVIGILQMVSVLTTSKVAASIDQSGFTTLQNTTYANLQTNTYNSYSLGGTAQLVLAAMTIVATVFGIFYMVNRG
jgi:hypothetical protein